MFFLYFSLLGIFGLVWTNIAPKSPSLPEEPVSKSLYLFYQEDISDSGKAFFSLILKIRAEIKKDPSYRLPPKVDDEVRKFYNSNPYEFMKIIWAFHDRNMVLITCLLLNHDLNFNDWAKGLSYWYLEIYQTNTEKVYIVLNLLIGFLLRKPYSSSSNMEEKERQLNERKKVVKIILLILQEIDNSNFEINFPFLRRNLSTRSFIRIMTKFIDGIVADSLAGAQVVNFHLNQFGKKYPGTIHSKEPFQEEITTLLMLWRFYARHITHNEYANIDVEDLDPRFLAQLIETKYEGYLEEIYTFFSKKHIVSKAASTLYGLNLDNFRSSLIDSKRKIGKIGCLSNFISTSNNWSEMSVWELKVYIKLLRCQIRKK
jgi:hypothetical protein